MYRLIYTSCITTACIQAMYRLIHVYVTIQNIQPNSRRSNFVLHNEPEELQCNSLVAHQSFCCNFNERNCNIKMVIQLLKNCHNVAIQLIDETYLIF